MPSRNLTVPAMAQLNRALDRQSRHNLLCRLIARRKDGQLAEDDFPETPPALRAAATPPEPAKQAVTVGAASNGEFPIF